MKDKINKIHDKVNSYINFITKFSFYNKNYFDFINELFILHKNVIQLIEIKKIELDDSQFRRFKEIITLKISPLIDLDFDEYSVYRNFINNYYPLVDVRKLELKDIINFQVESQLFFDLGYKIDDYLSYYSKEDYIVDLQSNFRKIAAHLSLKEINEILNKLVKETLVSAKKNEFNLKSIALYFRYSEKELNNANKDENARRFGFENGNKLIQEYNKFASRTDRIGLGTENQNKLKKKYFENAIVLLKRENDLKQLSECKKDYKTFKNKI